jgi:hypothetical protein
MTTEPPDGAVTYAYRPSVLGATWSYRLGPDAIAWDTGRRSGEVAFREITRVRLSYRPLTMQTQRYRMEIWSTQAPKLDLVSTSWKSMVEQERLDESYVAFVEELHRCIVAAGAPVQFETGINRLIYWPGMALLVVTSLGLALMTVRALAASVWVGAALVAAFLVLFLWQGGNFFRRNRPAVYEPLALPPDLLPRRKA